MYRINPVLALLASLLILGCSDAVDDAASEAPLAVSEAALWLPPPGASTAAAYMQLHNRGGERLVIDTLSSPDFAKVELHDMRTVDGMMEMRELSELAIAPGESAALEAHGRHLMLIEPRAEIAVGDPVSLRIAYRVGERRLEHRLSLEARAR